MDNRHDDISASDLLAKLKANMAEAEPQGKPESVAPDARKKYHFRRSGKSAAAVTEADIRREMPKEEGEVFVSPVPKSDIEELDIEALMKKYLPEEDYEKMTSREQTAIPEEEDELVRTLTSIELTSEEAADGEGEEDALLYEEDDYAAPDSELFAHLSKDGKVCDVPGEDEKSDTRPAPLRPMTEAERTLAYGSLDEEDTAFGSVRELLRAEEESDQTPVSMAETTETAFVDEAPTAAFAPAEEAENEPAEETENEPAEETENEPDEAPAYEAEEEIEGLAEEPAETEEETPAFETAEFSPEDILNTVEFAVGDTSVFHLPTEVGAVSEEDETLSSEEEEIPVTTDAEEAEDAVPEDMAVAVIGEEGESDAEEDRSDNAFDETDANLMLAFGMDEELDRAIGKESADKLRSDMDGMAPEEEKPAKEKAKRAEPVKEYISPAETKDVFEAYKVAYGKSMLRLFGMIALAVVLFFYENVTVFGGRLADGLNPEYYPVVNVMVGLQILLLGFALCFNKLIKGVRGLIDKKPTPDSFLPLLLAVSVIYSICVCFFPAGTKFVTFHFPVMLCLLLTVLNERLDLRREIMSFNIVSSKRGKFALEKLDIDDAELEARAFDGFLPKSPSIFRINKTSFIDGFFRRTREYPSLKLMLGALIPGTLVVLVMGVLVGVFKFRTWQDAVMLGYTAFSFAMPATVFFTFGLPAFKASKLAYNMNSAFVGEAALDEYTTAASISFDDREVFPTGGVKLRSIKVFGSGRIDTVIYNVASVYAILGGPLADVLNVATADLGRSEEAEVLSVETEGVEAVVDGKHLYLGKADYLRKYGYLPVSDPDDEEIEGGGEVSIMFLVCEDEVIAKLYVRYAIDPEFEITLKNLYRSGICVGIKTVDPNINDEMLSTRIRLSKYPVRVLKYTDVNDNRRSFDRTDSGIVSKKSVKALLRTFTLCDKAKHVTRTNLVINAITMVVGLVIAMAVAFLGSVAGVHSVYVALFQLFWLVPVYLLSKFLLM